SLATATVVLVSLRNSAGPEGDALPPARPAAASEPETSVAPAAAAPRGLEGTSGLTPNASASAAIIEALDGKRASGETATARAIHASNADGSVTCVRRRARWLGGSTRPCVIFRISA